MKHKVTEGRHHCTTGTMDELEDWSLRKGYFAETLIDWGLSKQYPRAGAEATQCSTRCPRPRKMILAVTISASGVPELKDVQGKAIFAPHARLPKADFEKPGYPRPHIDCDETKARAKE